MDFAGTGPFQNLGTGANRRAASIDIIDQDDALSGNLGTLRRVNRKGTAHGLGALPGPHRAQIGRCARSAQGRKQQPFWRIRGQRTGYQRRLVIAAPPKPPAMQWHGDKHCIVEIAYMALKIRSDRPGRADASAIFQTQRDYARHIAITDRRPQRVKCRRIAHTSAAQRLRVRQCNLRIAALRTSMIEMIERYPALQAEAIIAIDYLPTGRAAWWKRKINRCAGQISKDCSKMRHAILSRTAPPGTSPTMESQSPAQDKPFDRTLRRMRRDRAFGRWSDHAFLQDHMAAELIERLGGVQRDFKRALILGYPGEVMLDRLRDQGIAYMVADAGFQSARGANGVQCDEDRLPFADASFDLVLAVGTLDTVNDLPGALVLIRRCLRPDGLFLGACIGSGSLVALREAMLSADLALGGAAPRIHPQIDIRAAGDLLGRAGFALQVADGESLTVRYPGLNRLIGDLRGSANASLLKAPPIKRAGLATAHAAFEARQEDGKTSETFEIIYLTGWSPSPDQPMPAARGSGTTSLADALKPRD